MGSSLLTFIGQATTVALIVIATRWIIGAKGPDLPRIHNGTSVYATKWQWSAITVFAGAFCIVVTIGSWRQQHSPPWTFILVSVACVLIGLWFATGTVTTNQNAITKRVFWHSQSFRWSDITKLRLDTRQGGSIELRAGQQKMTLDFRFVAFQHLLNEIKDQTKLQPSAKQLRK